MATTTTTTTLTMTDPHTAIKHGAYQRPSPPDSSAGTTTPPANLSPTNNYHVNVRQLRQPRQPLYVPAALRPPTSKSSRPTDIPARPRAPDTPPASQDGSFDDPTPSTAAVPDILPVGDLTAVLPTLQPSSSSSPPSALVRSSSDPHHHNNLFLPQHRRQSSSDSTPDADSIHPSLSEVTGLPTTAHWKPDASSAACAVCSAPFTWFFRRHHCRRCGDLVCDSDSRFRVPLDQHARYHPKGTASKACKPCFQEWSSTATRSGVASLSEESDDSRGTAVAIPNIPLRSEQNARVGSLARSEGGMVWSTF